MATPEPEHGQMGRGSLGGDYWQVQTEDPLWGFADLHAHLMAHLAFGGRGFWGQPYDPDPGHSGDEAMEHALCSCAPIHGGLINMNPEFGHPAAGGWPDFIVWPRFTTLVHQQGYVDWLRRAYEGGLRLITCLAVNNELLASRTEPVLPHDDRGAIEVQIAGMKEMIAFLDRQCGGPGQGWMQIAYSPEQARQIIARNKLAVVLGVEVDSLGNWRRSEDLQRLSQGDPDQARQIIAGELDWLVGLGVRQITPVHLTNNALGGTAIFLRFLDVVNHFVTGEHYEVEDAWDSRIRYRLDRDGVDVVDSAERSIALEGRTLSPQPAMNHYSLVHHLPGIGDLVEAIDIPFVPGSHANARGLTAYGHILLEEMMRRGMLIDIDHMSQRATDDALTRAEAHGYPVISSHTGFRDLAFGADVPFDPAKADEYGTHDVHKVMHEGGKRADQIERIARLGGMIAPILNLGDMAGLERAAPDLAQKVPQPCAGSSTSWAQAYLYAVEKMGGRGVALGSDLNGAASLPGPRFGTFAAYGARGDACRELVRRAQIDAQKNGVRYDTPIRDYRWYRFADSGSGAYDEEEQTIWQAIAQYRAGFNPWTQQHPPEDFPQGEVREFLERMHVRHDIAQVDAITKGFWAADEDRTIGEPQEEGMEWCAEQRAAYLVGCGEEPGSEDGDETRRWFAKIRGIWNKWADMEGENPPLRRYQAGPRRDFDINLDGLAHYGLLPDFLQDVKNLGLSTQDLAPLFRSAADYVEVWEQCEQRAKAAQVSSP